MDNMDKRVKMIKYYRGYVLPYISKLLDMDKAYIHEQLKAKYA
jgi:hypothetical protein